MVATKSHCTQILLPPASLLLLLPPAGLCALPHQVLHRLNLQQRRVGFTLAGLLALRALILRALKQFLHTLPALLAHLDWLSG